MASTPRQPPRAARPRDSLPAHPARPAQANGVRLQVGGAQVGGHRRAVEGRRPPGAAAHHRVARLARGRVRPPWMRTGRLGRATTGRCGPSQRGRRAGLCLPRAPAAGSFGFMADLTRILSAIEQGDSHAAEQLLPLVYDELRQMAAQKLAQEKAGTERYIKGTRLVITKHGIVITSRAPYSLRRSAGKAEAAGGVAALPAGLTDEQVAPASSARRSTFAWRNNGQAPWKAPVRPLKHAKLAADALACYLAAFRRPPPNGMLIPGGVGACQTSWSSWNRTG